MFWGYRDMFTLPELAELIQKNPKTHGQLDTIQKAQEMLDFLRKNGTPDKTYDLVSPYDSRSLLHQRLGGRFLSSR